MPSTNSRNLTLTTVNQTVTINVKYKAVFNKFERFLASNGLRFVEFIEVVGDDPGTAGDRVLTWFGPEDLPVTAGTTSQTITRNRSKDVPRSSLQEDIGSDADEIYCRIRIVPVGIPVEHKANTDTETLLG